MQKIHRIALMCFLLCTAAAQSTRIVTEDFATDPLQRGWDSFGANDLIRWSAENQNVQVAWDSSKPNHYLLFPLQTIVQRADDFAVSLDLVLHDFAAGVTETKRGTFQIAFGFQNHKDATGTNFMRAANGKAPNLVEFNFLPDTGFGPTIWPAIFSTNGGMNYSGPSDFNIFDLPTGVPMRVALVYTATNETATLTITADGVAVGPPTAARLATNDVGFGRAFTQFKLDTFAIASYSDAGYGGSILAHGVIDNIVLSIPPPAIREINGQFVQGAWEVSFLSRTNWSYTLQASIDFTTWSDRATAVGNDGRLTVADLNASGAVFYRIHAQRLD